MTKNLDSGDGGALPEPHDNSDIEARLHYFVQGYYEFTKDAAHTYIRKCQLVLEAEGELPAEAIQQFFDRIRLPRNSATYRKVRKIAEAGDRLLRVADKLPDSWTTLYQLAMMKPHVFDELVQDDVLHPDITAADLLAAKEKRSEKVAKEQFIVTIDGSELSRGEQIQMYREVKEAVDGYGATISDIPLALEDEEEAQ
jgi:hypothetical protein